MRNMMYNKEYSAKYSLAHKDKIKEYKRIWYQKHKKGIKIGHKKYYNNNKERLIAKNKRYYNAHKMQVSAKHKIYRESHKEKIKSLLRINWLRRNYGIDPKDFDNLLLIQNNKCLICGQPLDLQNPKNVCVDHNHLTGKIRGILCNKCNLAIGLLRDNPEYTKRATEYLERNTKNEK